MQKIKSFIVSTIIFVIVILFNYFIWMSNLYLKKEKINLTIDSLIVFAALISAIYIINSFIQSNISFNLSIKPSLLIQIVPIPPLTPPQGGSPIHRTDIHYLNTTNYDMENLNFEITVFTNSKKIDLNYLFRKDIFMPAHDQRDRRFDTFVELLHHGFDLIQEITNGNEVRLQINYSFMFMKKIENRLAQEYKWNNSIHYWEIF